MSKYLKQIASVKISDKVLSGNLVWEYTNKSGDILFSNENGVILSNNTSNLSLNFDEIIKIDLKEGWKDVENNRVLKFETFDGDHTFKVDTQTGQFIDAISILRQLQRTLASVKVANNTAQG